MKNLLVFLCVALGSNLAGAQILNEFKSGDIRMDDDIAIRYGADNDFYVLYDEATSNRLELSDGTNEFLSVTDNGTSATFDFNDTLTINGNTINVAKVNAAASAAPTATDDSAAGYSVGSLWADTTGDKLYMCIDATASAAVWWAIGATYTDDIARVTLTNDGDVPMFDAGTSALGAQPGPTGDWQIFRGNSANTYGVLWDNPHFPDNKIKIEDDGDGTKEIDFELSGITTSTVRTITMGDGDYLLAKQNLAAAVAPTTTDDSASGYAVGSLWIDTTADTAYICSDSTASAAVWEEVGSGAGSSLPVTDTTSIAEGSSDATKEVRFEVDGLTTGTVRVITVGDADHTLAKQNWAASTAPGTSNDDSEGYEVGSVWIDTTADKSYRCLDASTGAAVWTETTQGGGGSLPVADTTSIVEGSADATKELRFEVDGLTTATTRVWTVGDRDLDFTAATGDVAIVDTATEYTGTHNFNATTLTDAATIAWDLAANQVCSVTLTDNRAMGTPTNLVDGATYVLIVKQDATGGRTLTFPATYKFPAGVDPTMSTGANDVDIIYFVSDGTSLFGTVQYDFN